MVANSEWAKGKMSPITNYSKPKEPTGDSVIDRFFDAMVIGGGWHRPPGEPPMGDTRPRDATGQVIK